MLAHTLPPENQPAPVAWLWPGWLPRGMVTLLCGAPGVGKSYVAQDLARSIIQGEPFPDGAPVPPALAGKDIAWVDGDGITPQIYQQAAAWRMDMAPVSIMPDTPGELLDFSQREYRERFIELVLRSNPVLAVVDSLEGVLDGGDVGPLAPIRETLAFLESVAYRCDCAVLVTANEFGRRHRGANLVRSAWRLRYPAGRQRTGARGYERQLEVLRSPLAPAPSLAGPLKVT